MLSHAGLPYASEVSKWIFKNSEVTKNSKDAFSTSKNSKKTAFHWREEIDFENVEKIQKECFQEMNRLHYLLVNNTITSTSNIIEPSTFT